MSSISKRPNGHRWLTYQFGGKRHTLRLGLTTDAAATEFQLRLDRLLEFVRLGLDPEPALIAWRSKLDERLYKCLCTAGLAPPRGPDTLDQLLAAHEARLIARGRKSSTLTNARVLHANLRKFFSGTRRIQAISVQEADQFRAFLRLRGNRDGEPLAVATVNNRCRRARTIFAMAVESEWLSRNPFREITTGREWNERRNLYVSVPLFTKIIGKSADHELRALLALVRFCGLRCPSEIRGLTWGAVAWEANTIVVYAPKNDEYDSGRREVPLFAPIMPYLLAHCERCGDDSAGALMFPRHQKTGAAITGRLATLCRKAGEVLFTKPFVNLRASGERDAFLAGHSIDEIAQWWGHSPEVALRHYKRIAKERAAAAGALRPSSEATNPKRNPKRRSCS